MNDAALDFDYDSFKQNAERERFYGQVVQHWKDGKLVLISVERSFQIKDFHKIVEISRGFV